MAGNSGVYVFRDGKMVKVSDKVRIRPSIVWPSGNVDGYISEHLDDKPVYVSSKSRLRYEMDSRGLVQKET